MPTNTPQTDFFERFSVIAELLACPACGGELRLEADQLVCAVCGVAYPIVDGIPGLTPPQGSV